ncbi:MAG: CbiQ family ECF transporter T component, partial [Syntrophomonadaceae bacterium]|nr:CbiQ family ECF transporter T component [Syntrophomonadaceae bacterium]
MIIDRYAWHSPLRTWHPAEKLQIMLAGMLLSLVSSRPGANLLFFFLYALLTLGAARVRLRDYLCLLLVPGFFLAAGAVAIPLSFQPTTNGWWWSAGGIGLGISRQGLVQAELL